MATSPIAQTASPLVITASNANRQTTLTCSGKLALATAENFTAEVKRWVECSSAINLDLAGLTYMDSAGLGALVGAYTSAKNATCEFRLHNLTPRVVHLLQLTNLDKVLQPSTANLL